MTPTAAPRKSRVLIVDDSAVVRRLLTAALADEPDIEVVGSAADPIIAADLIGVHRPDVLTLDLEMPRMDGLTFLRQLMQQAPMPVIVVSSATQAGSAASIEALRAGAIDVVAKPNGPHSVGPMGDRLKRRIRALREVKIVRLSPAVAPAPAAPRRSRLPGDSRRSGLIAIGASTGGTQAIEALLTRMPEDCPPIVVVQHMPANFTRAFADRLNGVCPMRVVEARGGEPLVRGVAYIAPGDYHMIVERNGVNLQTRLQQGPALHHQRPAVDVLFDSVAKIRSVRTVGILLTGMGSDGADGMVRLRAAGAQTIAEDEQSCVVFGMPKEAIARGGATHVASLLRMPALIEECFDRMMRVSA
ncbi:MAG TPA: chemotaxis response regulator protein-glutamate methylesterase [Vicinamibacterales bacterium]|nr:chemotaxis response regulator protein-glutamate methylesterase [Vicinamibacterales bacterium]